MKILVTGSKGQLGSEIRLLSSDHDHAFEFVDIDQLDLSDPDAIIPFLEKAQADFIINCAAYTAVDKAEDEPILAEQINALAPEKIAGYCSQYGKRLIHISTDYVFDGNDSRPINEEALPDPQSVYGATKLRGEQAVQALLPDAYIIRTAWVYSAFGNNFVKTMLRLGREREEISVVSDQFGSPTYARDLAAVILTIADQMIAGNDHPGIYHYSNEGSCSWYEFATEIMKQANLDCKVHPIPTSAYPTKAKRPQYSLLDKSKIKKLFEMEIDDWKKSLGEMLSKY